MPVTEKGQGSREQWLDVLERSLQHSYEHFSKDGNPPDLLGEKSLEVFRRMRACKACTAVWASIERRTPADAKTLQQQYHEDYLREEERLRDLAESGAEPALHNSDEWWAERNADFAEQFPIKKPTHFVDVAYGLVDTIAKALLHDFEPETTSMRRKRAAKIKKAVDRLSREMRFHEVGDTLQPFLMDFVRDRVTQLALDDLKMFEITHDVKLTERDRAVAMDAVNKVTVYPEDMLRTFKDAADAWAEAPLELPRPNDPNAARLLLLRRVTDYFVKHLETPLYDSTALIAMEFFRDSGALDGESVRHVTRAGRSSVV